MAISRRIVLHFPERLVEQPIICRLARDFNLEFNILKAAVTPNEEGLLVLELNGEQKDYDRGIQYLTETGIRIQSLSQNVIRNEERCTHCGACITICPTGAFIIEPSTRLVDFSDTKCIVCGLCIKACPLRAMELKF
ncbi:MAG: (Fe-S)-binding protein [Chloroflexi bacterium CG23_combo_of_CG06-09_8_20_14_all_45_10]|nr:MAG: (Fe-S)-binding protein [Chloroflexi bacterium CG23_combo_of_CG06-09_8_20_14_all_45_10]